MSVTVSKADEVTVLTLTSDPQSLCPPLCQIIKNLCYSPVCCSVSENLRKVLKSSLTVLGTLQIMVGLLNFGFGSILLSSRIGDTWTMFFLGYPYWLGALFILFGIMCILSDKYPSLCLITITVILNLAGAAFAVTAIVLYSINLGSVVHEYYDYCGDLGDLRPDGRDFMMEKVSEGRTFMKMLAISLDAILIILSTLEFCVVISTAVLGIKALKSRANGQNKDTDDPDHLKPLLKENLF
ncbi:membrane-spanning 4-domains subfamily A member 15-like isoform 2-T2 [Pholidichthys leucotaenia]